MSCTKLSWRSQISKETRDSALRKCRYLAKVAWQLWWYQWKWRSWDASQSLGPFFSERFVQSLRSRVIPSTGVRFLPCFKHCSCLWIRVFSRAWTVDLNWMHSTSETVLCLDRTKTFFLSLKGDLSGLGLQFSRPLSEENSQKTVCWLLYTWSNLRFLDLDTNSAT